MQFVFRLVSFFLTFNPKEITKIMKKKRFKIIHELNETKLERMWLSSIGEEASNQSDLQDTNQNDHCQLCNRPQLNSFV
jgi:hypothetical protein